MSSGERKNDIARQVMQLATRNTLSLTLGAPRSSFKYRMANIWPKRLIIWNIRSKTLSKLVIFMTAAAFTFRVTLFSQQVTYLGYHG